MSERKKIIVIADDFTGAAEIGGIGLRHGLNVAIETEPIDSPDIDLMVLATDTRSMAPEDAAKVIKELTEKALKLNPYLIYKKIDSVLRGNITEELSAQMDVMNFNRCIIIAGNPIFNRVIKKGRYYINNEPLNETCFASDSQHPRTTNKIKEILTPSDKYPVSIANKLENLPNSGMIMGDVETIEDLLDWAKLFREDILFAGASGFFNSLLSHLKISKQEIIGKSVPFGNKRFFVLGSSFPKAHDILPQMEECGHYYSNMPEEVFYNNEGASEAFNKWINEIIDAFKMHPKVIISSIHQSNQEPDLFIRIKRLMAEVVKKVTDKIKVDEILIEGGSTTSEILNELQIKRLVPLQEFTTGVIRMQVTSKENMCMTTKPGSYSWPEELWLNNNIDKLTNSNLTNSTING